MKNNSYTPSKAPATVTVMLVPDRQWAARGRPGATQKWTGTLDGSVLVEGEHDPEYAVCRVLAAMGVAGRVAFVHADTGITGMTMDIMQGAGLTTYDADDKGLRTRRYQPHLWSGAGARGQIKVAGGGIASGPSSPATLREYKKAVQHV